MRNWFDEALGCRGGSAIKLGHLHGSGPGGAQNFAFGNYLTHKTDLLCLGRIEAAPSEQQVSHRRIAQIALQTRDSAVSGDEAQAKLRETKPGQFVGDDQVAGQGQFKTATESHTVNR